MILCFYTSDRLSPILLCSFGARLIPLYLISSSFSLSLFFSAHGKLLLQLRAWNFRLRNDGCSMQREGTEQRADRTGSFNFNYALSFDVHFLRVLFIVIILFGRLETERERESDDRRTQVLISVSFSSFWGRPLSPNPIRVRRCSRSLSLHLQRPSHSMISQHEPHPDRPG